MISVCMSLTLVLDVTELLPDVVVDDLVVAGHFVDELEEFLPQLIGLHLKELGVVGYGLDDVDAVDETLVLVELDQQPLLVVRQERTCFVVGEDHLRRGRKLDRLLHVHLHTRIVDISEGEGKGGVQLLIAHPSQSYGASPDIWDDTVLAATQHR